MYILLTEFPICRSVSVKSILCNFTVLENNYICNFIIKKIRGPTIKPKLEVMHPVSLVTLKYKNDIHHVYVLLDRSVQLSNTVMKQRFCFLMKSKYSSLSLEQKLEIKHLGRYQPVGFNIVEGIGEIIINNYLKYYIVIKKFAQMKALQFLFKK